MESLLRRGEGGGGGIPCLYSSNNGRVSFKIDFNVLIIIGILIKVTKLLNKHIRNRINFNK